MNPQELSLVKGSILTLRLVELEDAEYLFKLRTNKKYNSHMSPVSGTVEDQKSWIISYKERESRFEEFYYILENLEDIPCGTVRLYNINSTQFTWGSWILDQNKPRKAALESALLSFGIGFEQLGLESALVDVRIANQKAYDFYVRLGMSEIYRDDLNIYFNYNRDQFAADKDRLMNVVRDGSAHG